MEVSRRWDALFQEAKSLADAGRDPGGDEAQALAARWMALVNEFTHGDASITAGLKRFWEQYAALPDEERPMPKALNDSQQAFVDRALALYNSRKGE